MPTSYLISGANRGIGLGLTRLLVQRPDTIVFAGVRDLSNTKELDILAKSSNGRIYVAKLAAGDVSDAQALNELVEKEAGHLDILIANAGICDYLAPLATSELDQFRRYFEINTLGPVVLYQELRSSLLKSTSPKFVAISTGVASLGAAQPFPASPYLVSKASLNAIVQKIALEESAFVSIAISPGWVQTDMGNAGAKASGMDAAPVTITDSVNGIVKLIDEAEKESHNGVFWDYTGEKLVW